LVIVSYVSTYALNSYSCLVHTLNEDLYYTNLICYSEAASPLVVNFNYNPFEYMQVVENMENMKHIILSANFLQVVLA